MNVKAIPVLAVIMGALVLIAMGVMHHAEVVEFRKYPSAEHLDRLSLDDLRGLKHVCAKFRTAEREGPYTAQQCLNIDHRVSAWVSPHPAQNAPYLPSVH